MIQVNILFWTNDIAPTKGRILPKHAWADGIVRVERNSAHGIDGSQEAFFHSLMDLNAKIEKLLLANGIVLHPGRRMSKYVQTKTPPHQARLRRAPARPTRA
jgi:hypothetical protein